MAMSNQFDLSVLPEKAQEELYNFYLFLKQRYLIDEFKDSTENTALLSENVLAIDWNKEEEDKAWKSFQ
jgi:hypothetical protein